MKKPDGSKIGIVSIIYGAYYNILPLPDLTPELRGRLRGKLRLEKSKADNTRLRHLIMVGDRVRYSPGGRGDDEVIIEGLEERRNALFRTSTHEQHALGSNVDQAVLVTSLADPEPNFRFVDRFLAGCYAGGVEPILLFTKTDLLKADDPESEYKLALVDEYRELRYRAFTANLLAEPAEKSLLELRELLASGTTLLAGRSGTGKSTLLNQLMGDDVQKTGAVSSTTGKGRHTTTNSTLVTRDRAMFIDTPGVKEWGILHLNRVDVIESFRELQGAAENCPFANCEHRPEDGHCEVQKLLKLFRELYLEEEAAEDDTDDSENHGGDSEDALPDLIMSPERLESLYALLESLRQPDRIRTGDYIKSTGRMRSGSGTSRALLNRTFKDSRVDFKDGSDEN